jgi:ATP-binding cassette subfamily B protein
LTDARIELRDVSFAYRADEPVLNRMSFVAEPGKVTAGRPSGGGRSTVLALLLRFYEVTAGRDLVDGQSIASVSRKSLRHQTGYVGQDVYLFRDTIGANIAFGKVGATRDEIEAAARPPARTTSSWAFRSVPDTPVGEAPSFPAGSASVSRWRARCSRTRRSSCSTKPLRRSIQIRETGAGSHRTSLPEPHHDRDRHRLHTIMHADAITGGRGRRDRRARPA